MAWLAKTYINFQTWRQLAGHANVVFYFCVAVSDRPVAKARRKTDKYFSFVDVSRREKNGAARPSQDSLALFWRFSERSLEAFLLLRDVLNVTYSSRFLIGVTILWCLNFGVRKSSEGAPFSHTCMFHIMIFPLSDIFKVRLHTYCFNEYSHGRPQISNSHTVKNEKRTIANISK